MSYTENFIDSGIWNSIERWIPDYPEELEEESLETDNPNPNPSSFNYKDLEADELLEPYCHKCGDSGCYNCMDCDKDYWSDVRLNNDWYEF